MSLGQIDLRAEFNDGNIRQFNIESWCVPQLYWSFLRGYETGKVMKCLIEVSDNWGDKEFRYTSYPQYRSINLTMDLEKYFESSKKEKKKVQLDLIHKGMMMIADREGWATDPLLDAYSACLSAGLEYKFFVDGKFKASPDRKRKAGLWCEWDIDFFGLFWVLFDKQGKETARDIVVSLEPNRGQSVYYLKWKWLDNETLVIDDKFKYGTRQTWKVKLPSV